MPYVISGPVEDGETLYWSNVWGWTGRDEASVFSEAERHELNLPLEGKWERV